MDRTNRIIVTSTGESWGGCLEIRPATEEDVHTWWNLCDEEMKVGDMIIVYDGEDFVKLEDAEELLYLYITDKEMDELFEGLYPRKLDGFWDRVRSVEADVVTIQRLWRRKHLRK